MGGEGSGKAKGDLLVLNGTALVDGKLEKTDFFNFLATDLSDYSHVVMTPDQALRFKNSIVRMKHGVSAAIPMLCSGPKCMNKMCVFHSGKNWPIGIQCLIETRLIQALTKSYMEDLNVDPESPSEMTLINKLVECDLLDYRANIGLSGGNDPEAATLLKTNVVDNGKTTSETTNIHPLLEVKTRLHKDRMLILESFAVTRKEKYKKAAALKKSEDTDASRWLAQLKSTFGGEGVQEEVTSLEKIKQDAEKVSKDLIFEADWSADE